MNPLVTRSPDVTTLAQGRLRFRDADPVTTGEVEGDWRIEVTGPQLVHDRWDRALQLAGASGLVGLRLDGRGDGHLLHEQRRRAPQVEGRRLRAGASTSRLDGLACLAVTFPQPDRVPWPWLRIEVRRLVRQGTWPVPDGWLLAMAMIDLPGRVPIPVLLRRDE